MPKYLVLYKAADDGQGPTEEPSQEQQQAIMQAWFDWKASAAEAIVDFGAPTAQISAGEPSGVGGYSIVQAPSAHELSSIFENNPHRQHGGALEIHELMDIPAP